MERLNGKKAYVPKNFQVVQSFSGNLSFNPSNVVDPLLIKNLLYHSYGIECSIEDYSIELGIARPYIEDYVKELVNKDFLIKLENGKYLTNIAFINKKEPAHLQVLHIWVNINYVQKLSKLVNCKI